VAENNKAEKQRVCIVCIAKDEDRTIQEWVDYHLKLGFDKIFIYQNDWTCPIECAQLVKLRADGNERQMPAYNHWLSSGYRNDFDWVAIIDCDEFIVLHKHKTISEFISEFDVTSTAGVSANWVMFGSGGQQLPTPNPESLIKRFTFRQKDPYAVVKPILNLKMKFSIPNPHYPSLPTIDTNHRKFVGAYNPDGPIDIIQINHYQHKSRQEWIERIQRGSADGRPKQMDNWDKESHSYHDVEDLKALNFLYGGH